MLFVALSAFPTTEMSRNAAIALAQQLAIASPKTSIDTLIRRALVDAFTDNQMPEESDRERLHIHPLLRAFAGEAFKQWPGGNASSA
jgi:hypothetical protein